MRFILATIAVAFLVASADATSFHLAEPHNVYLPPVHHQHQVVSNYHPTSHVVTSVHRPVVHQVLRQQHVYQSPIVDYRPAVHQVARPRNVYLPPAVVHHSVVHPQRVYESHVTNYSPVVHQPHAYAVDYQPVARPHNVYLPPATVQHDVVQPRNTYLPPAQIDLRNDFVGRR